MKNNIGLIVIVAVFIGAGGFFAGMKYEASRSSATRQFVRDGAFGNAGQAGRSKMFGGGRTYPKPVIGILVIEYRHNKLEVSYEIKTDYLYYF